MFYLATRLGDDDDVARRVSDTRVIVRKLPPNDVKKAAEKRILFRTNDIDDDDRYVMNYIRHKLTNYDRVRKRLALSRHNKAYFVWRSKVEREIKKIYGSLSKQ